jgi:hypothetical protein
MEKESTLKNSRGRKFGFKMTDSQKEHQRNMILGNKASKETKEKMRETALNRRMSGENNPNWKGGKDKKTIQERLAGRPKSKICEICGSNKRICFDHDHVTNKFRGWLCITCNFALGLVKDNKNTLKSMIKYLDKNPCL